MQTEAKTFINLFTAPAQQGEDRRCFAKKALRREAKSSFVHCSAKHITAKQGQPLQRLAKQAVLSHAPRCQLLRSQDHFVHLFKAALSVALHSCASHRTAQSTEAKNSFDRFVALPCDPQPSFANEDRQTEAKNFIRSFGSKHSVARQSPALRRDALRTQAMLRYVSAALLTKAKNYFAYCSAQHRNVLRRRADRTGSTLRNASRGLENLTQAKIVNSFPRAQPRSATCSSASFRFARQTKAKIVYRFAPSVALLSCAQRTPAEFTKAKIVCHFVLCAANRSAALLRRANRTKAKP